MTRSLFRAVAWGTASMIALLHAFGAYRFGEMVDSEPPGLATLLRLIALFAATQAGLIAAPWALSRGWWTRWAVAALMLPPALYLAFAACDGVSRVVSRIWILPEFLAVSVAGVVVYGWAYVLLARGGCNRARSLGQPV